MDVFALLQTVFPESVPTIPISSQVFSGSKIAVDHMAGMIIFVHFVQGLCFSGRVTARYRSIVIPTKLKMQPRTATLSHVKILFTEYTPKLAKYTN